MPEIVVQNEIVSETSEIKRLEFLQVPRGRAQISNTDGVLPFVILEAHYGPCSIQLSWHNLPWLIRVLLSAGIGVDGASDR